MESHTLINVAKKITGTRASRGYRHHFRVIINNAPEFCQEAIADLKKKFKAPAYEVEVHYADVVYRPVGDDFKVKGE